MTAYGLLFRARASISRARERPEHLRSLRVSADFFRTLGIQPVLGRSFTEDEDRPGGPNVVCTQLRRFGKGALEEIAELSAAPSGLAANCGPWSASR